MLIDKRKRRALKHFNDPNVFIEYLNDVENIFKNIEEEYNLNEERKILIVFYDAIADMLGSKILCPTFTELFIRGRKPDISLAFITQSYFAVPKTIRLNSTHCFILKRSNKREFSQIALSHSSDIDFQGFIKCTNICYKTIIFFSD